MSAGRVLLIAALAAVFCLGTDGGAAEAQEPDDATEVVARAWVLVDTESGRYLAGKNAEARLPMGSTNKMMVALVGLDAVAAGEADLDEEVVVSEEAASFANPVYSNVGLRAGDVLTVRELVLATLISSGNDASWALAEHLGGGGEAGVERFVGMMNERTRALGLEDTRFRNATGLDAGGQHSSARDLAAIARAGFGHPLFREAVATPHATVSTQDRTVELATTNELLSYYPAATGVKTGYTLGAGPCLVASAAKDDEAYVSVVLGDEQRFGDSRRLLEYGFSAYDQAHLVVRDRRYAEVDVPYRREQKIELVAAEGLARLVGKSTEVEHEVDVDGQMPDSVMSGDVLGEVVVSVEGEVVGQVPLVARQGYEEASLWQRIRHGVEDLWEHG